MGIKGGAVLAAASGVLLFTLGPIARVLGRDATRTVRLPLVVSGSTIRVTPALPRATATPVATSALTATPVATSAPTATPVATSAPTATPVATSAPTATPTAPRQAILRVGVRARIMPIGDSLTRGGEDLNTPHYAYRGPLQKRLRESGYAYDFVGSVELESTFGDDDQHDGHAGYTIGGTDPVFDASGFKMGITDNITRYLAAAPAPDVILLLIGINDVFFNRVQGPSAPDRLTALVDIIKAQRPNAKIVVASLVRLQSETEPRDLAASISNRARYLGELSPNDNVTFVDLAAVSLQPADYVDEVHLSQSGASKIADAWFIALTQ
jgi:lysophospholipase L1-like esterase